MLHTLSPSIPSGAFLVGAGADHQPELTRNRDEEGKRMEGIFSKDVVLYADNLFNLYYYRRTPRECQAIHKGISPFVSSYNKRAYTVKSVKIKPALAQLS